MIVKGGSADITTYFQMRLLAGGDATGLTIGDFDLSYTRTRTATAAKVDAVALAAADTAHTDNRGIEVDPTDCQGLYRFDWPDAAFAAGAAEVILTVKHASCFTESLRVEIDPFGAGFSRATDAIVNITVGSGSTTTSIVASAISPATTEDTQLKGLVIKFPYNTTTAALRGQGCTVTAFDHATQTFTVTALTEAPVSGDIGVIN